MSKHNTHSGLGYVGYSELGGISCSWIKFFFSQFVKDIKKNKKNIQVIYCWLDKKRKGVIDFNISVFVTASLACKELVETSSTVFLVYFLEVILITEIEYQSYFSPIDQN